MQDQRGFSLLNNMNHPRSFRRRVGIPDGGWTASHTSRSAGPAHVRHLSASPNPSTTRRHKAGRFVSNCRSRRLPAADAETGFLSPAVAVSGARALGNTADTRTVFPASLAHPRSGFVARFFSLRSKVAGHHGCSVGARCRAQVEVEVARMVSTYRSARNSPFFSHHFRTSFSQPSDNFLLIGRQERPGRAAAAITPHYRSTKMAHFFSRAVRTFFSRPIREGGRNPSFCSSSVISVACAGVVTIELSRPRRGVSRFRPPRQAQALRVRYAEA
jgi:hypothetical protein